MPAAARCSLTNAAPPRAAPTSLRTGSCPSSTSSSPSTSPSPPEPQVAKTETRESRLPPEVLNHRDDYDFIGRDGPILEMERALHLKTPCILLQGLGGVGKTTLARGFLRWLDETGGFDAALWFDFRDIRSAEFVLNRIGQRFYGENFGIAPNKARPDRPGLEEHRVIIIWDNFESTAQNLTNEDRAKQLGQLLDANPRYT